MIAAIGRTAFAEAYGPHNSPEDLSAHLAFTYTAEKIEAEMAARCEYLVAQHDSIDCGFGKLRHSENKPECIPGQNPFEVHQIYLLQPFHRRGIGSKLMDGLAELAVSKSGDGLFLGVWEKSTWAIGFYESWGMQKVGQQIFRVGEDDQTDWLMYRGLVSCTKDVRHPVK